MTKFDSLLTNNDIYKNYYDIEKIIKLSNLNNNNIDSKDIEHIIKLNELGPNIKLTL